MKCRDRQRTARCETSENPTRDSNIRCDPVEPPRTGLDDLLSDRHQRHEQGRALRDHGRVRQREHAGVRLVVKQLVVETAGIARSGEIRAYPQGVMAARVVRVGVSM